MLGRRRVPVKFQIFKSVYGIARSRYNNPENILETRENAEIARLRRLSDNHVLEITEPIEPIEEVPFEPEILEDLPWQEMRKRVLDLGHNVMAITKEECLLILHTHQATTPEECNEEDIGNEPRTVGNVLVD